MADSKQKARTGPDDLGIDLSDRKDSEVFKWLVACRLFGRRISQEIAADSFRELDRAGLLTPKKLADADWQRLVDLLIAGGYKRYDESTASELIKLGQDVQQHYDGRLSRILDSDSDKGPTKKAVKERVQEFKGLGPTAADIFVRELL